MERKIQNIFFDKANNIYLVDDVGVLYWYQKDFFYPFLEWMDDIKNCFMIGQTIFVHHDTTISQFSLSLYPLGNEKWITKYIDDVCYHKDLNIIVTLEQGEIYINYNVSVLENDMLDEESHEYLNTVKRVSLSHRVKYVNNTMYVSKYHKFEKIKIIDDFLMVYANNKINFFYLRMDDFKPLTQITAKQDIFDNISEVNQIYIFQMNGNIVNTDKLFGSHTNWFSCLNDPIYQKQKIYLLLKDGYLLCCYENNKYETIIEPLLKVLPKDFHSTVPITDSEKFTTVKLLKNHKVCIVSNNLKQLIFYDGKIYLINNMLDEISLDPDQVVYDHLNYYLKSSVKNDLVIDIDTNKSVFHQLMNIIPYLYRLNHDKNYCFEQIDQFSNVISYGIGVTRSIFTFLAKEIDEHFKNNFSSFKLNDAFNIGKLLFFCSWEGNERFFNVHPYFIYKLSKESDNIYLLKKFKGNDFNTYYQQYLRYYSNPKELVDLDLGLNDHNDYVKYLMLENLSSEQIAFYDLMADGFRFFAIRNKLNSLIPKLSINYYTNLLIADGYFNAVINFDVESDRVSDYYFEQFKRIFTKLFNKLDNKQIAVFCQNITGSQYYSDEINVVLAYDSDIPNSFHQIFDMDTIILNENNEPIDVNETIIDMDTQYSNEEKLAYKISTCNAEIIIYVMPTEENLENIINALVVEDLNMRQ